MSTKAKALAVATRYGFTLDQATSGPTPFGFTVIFDHPTHSLSGSCTGITCSNYGAGKGPLCWSEAITRMVEEAPHLAPCTNPACEYHNE